MSPLGHPPTDAAAVHTSAGVEKHSRALDGCHSLGARAKYALMTYIRMAYGIMVHNVVACIAVACLQVSHPWRPSADHVSGTF